MRRSVTAVMSGVSLVVVGVSLRASWEPLATTRTAGLARAGIVTTATPTPSPPAATVPKRTVAKPAPTATHRRTTGVAPAVTASPTPRPTRSAAPKSVAVNGAAVDTQYGPVQVQIVVRAGKIVKADAIEYPQGSGRDQEINSYAVPQLDDETLQAQSAQIDSVSGATYTSEGYIGSLQSAIDAAHNAGLL